MFMLLVHLYGDATGVWRAFSTPQIINFLFHKHSNTIPLPKTTEQASFLRLFSSMESKREQITSKSIRHKARVNFTTAEIRTWIMLTNI